MADENKYELPEVDARYTIEGYFGADHNGHPVGLESSTEVNEWSEVEEIAHEKLGGGSHVVITDNLTGGNVEIRPDMYFEDFEGEFPYKPQDLDNGVIVLEEYGKLIDLKESRSIVLETNSEDYVGGMDADGHEQKDNFEMNTETISFSYDAEAKVIRRDDSTDLYAYEGDPVSGMDAAREIREFAEKAQQDSDLRLYTREPNEQHEYENTPLILESPEKAIDREVQEASQKVQEATDSYNYMLLSRLQQDCKYVLNTVDAIETSTLRSTQKYLWAGDPEAQIQKMQELYDSFAEDAKPEWCTQQDIQNYANRFSELRAQEQAEHPYQELADSIEQVMFERGEYDYGEGDRVRWLDGVPNAYDLADSPALLDSTRQRVTDRIELALEGNARDEIGGIEPLMQYLNDQINEMDEEDELIPTCEKLLVKLENISQEQEQTQEATVKSLDEMELSDFTPEMLDTLKEDFQVVPMYAYLEDTYGNAGYNLADDLPNDDFEVDNYNDENSGEEWTIFAEEVNDSMDSIISGVSEYLNSLEPMAIVDKNGDIAPIPYYQDTEGKVITGKELDKKVGELIPEDITVTEYGRVIDNDYYSEPEAEERKTELAVSYSFEPTEFMMEAAKQNIETVISEHEVNLAEEHIYNMIKETGHSVERNEAGTYDIVNDENGAYRAINAESVREALESLDDVLNKANIENAALLANTEMLDKSMLRDVARAFHPEQSSRMPDEARHALTQELEETFADFASEFGVTIDTIPQSHFSASPVYALYDNEAGDYIKNSYDTPNIHNTGMAMTAMSEKVERVQTDLEEEVSDFLKKAVENGRNDADIKVPESPSEWVAFAGRPQNKEFVDEHKFELNVMRLSHEAEHHNVNPSLGKAMEIQASKTQEQNKAIEQKKQKDSGLGKA